MALFSPIYTLILPFLFIFTIPIALLATITTACAFSVLLFRVTLVYIELALAVIPHWLFGGDTTTKQLQRTKSLINTSSGRRKRRRGSTGSNVSATGMITPVSNDSVIGLSAGPTRDYEGVGGWRVDNPSDDDALWTKINSRLELPADHFVRRHHRSLTSGSIPGESSARVNRSYSLEAVMNTSRARTPPNSAIMGREEWYFPQVPISPKTSKRNSSSTGSTTSSKGSGLSIKQK